MPVSLADTITLNRSYAQVAMSLSVDPAINISNIGPMERNLAVRAARLLQNRYRVNEGVRIHIHKRIPIGGGMGGGSADAAGVLRGLNRLWNLNLPVGELESLGAELGSDIPALVHGGVVLMEGRGERVSSIQLPDEWEDKGIWMVIANPGIMCSTAEIFRKWKGDLTDSLQILHNMLSFIRENQLDSLATGLYNGLQSVVFDGYPEVAQAVQLLQEAGCLGALLSGSGASVFGLVRNKAHGEEVSRRLGKTIWNTVVRACPVV